MVTEAIYMNVIDITFSMQTIPKASRVALGGNCAVSARISALKRDSCPLPMVEKSNCQKPGLENV